VPVLLLLPLQAVPRARSAAPRRSRRSALRKSCIASHLAPLLTSHRGAARYSSGSAVRSVDSLLLLAHEPRVLAGCSLGGLSESLGAE
jgi:hypothetical protein